MTKRSKRGFCGLGVRWGGVAPSGGKAGRRGIEELRRGCLSVAEVSGPLMWLISTNIIIYQPDLWLIGTPVSSLSRALMLSFHTGNKSLNQSRLHFRSQIKEIEVNLLINCFTHAVLNILADFFFPVEQRHICSIPCLYIIIWMNETF